MPGEEIGCSASAAARSATFQRQKSVSSQAASISAWNAVFDWPSIVAAFIVSRHGPASSSAARRKTAARASHESADHSRRASAAAAIARATSSLAAPVVLAEDVLVVVRHDDVGGAPGAHLLAADHHRDLDLLGRPSRRGGP